MTSQVLRYREHERHYREAPKCASWSNLQLHNVQSQHFHFDNCFSFVNPHTFSRAHTHSNWRVTWSLLMWMLYWLPVDSNPFGLFCCCLETE